jgi:hypothetical protein
MKRSKINEVVFCHLGFGIYAGYLLRSGQITGKTLDTHVQYFSDMIKILKTKYPGIKIGVRVIIGYQLLITGRFVPLVSTQYIA